MKFFIATILTILALSASAMTAHPRPEIVQRAYETWENPVKRFLFWKTVKGADRLSLTCFEASDDSEAGCVCRGPKMYNTPTNASDDLFKYNNFGISEEDDVDALKEKARSACKPSGVIFG